MNVVNARWLVGLMLGLIVDLIIGQSSFEEPKFVLLCGVCVD